MDDAPTKQDPRRGGGHPDAAAATSSEADRSPRRRKVKPEAEQRRHGVTIWFTAAEHSALRQLRHTLRVPVARLVREAALQASVEHAPARPVRARPHDPDLERAITVLTCVENLLDEFASVAREARRAGVPTAQVAALLAGVELARDCCRQLVPLPDTEADSEESEVEPPSSCVVG